MCDVGHRKWQAKDLNPKVSHCLD